MKLSKFNFYKVSVEPTENLHLLAKPKNEIVEDAFDVDEPVTFTHWNMELAYVKRRRVGDYIIASLGKRSVTKISGPPQKRFETIEQEAWQNHLLLAIKITAISFIVLMFVPGLIRMNDDLVLGYYTFLLGVIWLLIIMGIVYVGSRFFKRNK